jgi:hypothetical protein
MMWTVAVALLACGSDPGPVPTVVGQVTTVTLAHTGHAPPTEAQTEMVLADADHATLHDELTLAELGVPPQTDLLVRTAGVLTDHAGRPLADDADRSWLLWKVVPSDEPLVEVLACNERAPRGSDRVLMGRIDGVGADGFHLSELSTLGQPFSVDELKAGDRWLLNEIEWLPDGSYVDRRFVVLLPREFGAASAVDVAFASSSTVQRLELPWPAPLPALPVDDATVVAELTVDLLGRPIDLEDSWEVVVARYDDEALKALLDDPGRWRSLANEAYAVPLGDDGSALLADATSPTGAFEGWSGDGTWLAALSLTYPEETGVCGPAYLASVATGASR